MNLKVRLAAMSFLEFAVWGSYLTCMGIYLVNIGMASNIGAFFVMQGVVSIFMPALMGIVADRLVPAQHLLGCCHLLAGLFMLAAVYYGMSRGSNAEFGTLFTLYSFSVAFYMLTLALTNSVAYNASTQAGMDTIKNFSSIRIFGTIGFICSMRFVDIFGFKGDQNQFVIGDVLSVLLLLYIFMLPHCPTSKGQHATGLVEAFGLKAFSLFKQKRMAIFFIFSMLSGVSLQITNGFATPFIKSFKASSEYAGTFGVKYPMILCSLLQVSETLYILMIPFFMKRYGIKSVVLIAMFAWVLRFALFGLGNPGDRVQMFALSMIIYGVAFDFFNISGSLYVDKATEPALRSSAQGLFMLMTNGIGATIGSLAAQAVVTSNTINDVTNWSACWYAFAGYALVVGVSFALLFKPKKNMVKA